MTLGWGIVGIGRVADTWMAPAISADPNSRIVEVVSRDQERANTFAAKHGAAVASTSFQGMLANDDVDVVMVTTPNALHADQVALAAAAGKHVYCDKPLALTAADARRAVVACQEAGVSLGMNFQTRHHRCFEVAREVIASGIIGDILTVQLDTGNAGRRPQGWRLDPVMAGHGVINNLAVHMYDLLRYLLGAEVVEVTALFDSGIAPRIELCAMTLLRFDNGTMAYTGADQLTPFPMDQIVIHGTHGRIDGRGITRLGREGEMRIVTEGSDTTEHYSNADCYQRCVRAFTDALAAGHEPDPSGWDGLRSLALTDAVARSARDRATVVLEPLSI